MGLTRIDNLFDAGLSYPVVIALVAEFVVMLSCRLLTYWNFPSLMGMLNGRVPLFGKYTHLLFCRELDDKIDTTHVCTVNMKLLPVAC